MSHTNVTLPMSGQYEACIIDIFCSFTPSWFWSTLDSQQYLFPVNKNLPTQYTEYIIKRSK